MSRIESENLKRTESAWAKRRHDVSLESLVDLYEKYFRQITGNKTYVFTKLQRKKLKENLAALAENME